MAACLLKNYGFYVTNPCFEFWLCLHFPRSVELEGESERLKICINSKAGNYSYIQEKLHSMFPEYSRKYKTIKFVHLKNNIDLAISNEAKYCEDIKSLKYEIGSNLGQLLKEMKQK